MNAPDKFLLPDVQAIVDTRSLAIDRVGVKSVMYPMSIRTASGQTQRTVVTADMFVGLPKEAKGTHMSRFLEVLAEEREALDPAGCRSLVERMLERLGADTGSIELSFPFFTRKRAPVSGVESLLDHRVVMRGEITRANGYRLTLTATVAATSLCPCSKEISAYGAHNQRSLITIRAQVTGTVSIEDLIAIAEEEASCQVYGLLKRPDEKWVTERAYDNPKFVEDLVRDIALRLDGHEGVAAYSVAAENFESIHNHSAYALIERDADHTV